MNKLPLPMAASKGAELDQVLCRGGLERKAARAFSEWPSLERVASQFIHYISPWLVINNEPVAEKRIAGAIEAYNGIYDSDHGHRAFIEHLAHTAKDLAGHRVSIQDRDGVWLIWSYDQPLTEFMSRHGRLAIQVRERDTPLPVAPVMIKLLAAVSTTRDMFATDINLAQLLDTGATTS